jgi:hypothetical protein
MRTTEVIVASEAGIAIRSVADISEALSMCLGSVGLILTERELSREFFDLRTGLAGEVFQKFINYRVRIAIVLVDPAPYGERFSELAHEHRTHGLIRFVDTIDDARTWLVDPA